MNRENQFKFVNNEKFNEKFNENVNSNMNNFKFNKMNTNSIENVNKLLIENYSINELSSMVIYELNLWHYYNTVIKEFSINNYYEYFGKTINKISNLEENISLINDEISNKIKNYPKISNKNPNLDYYYYNKNKHNQSNNNTNHLVDNIINNFNNNFNQKENNYYNFNNLVFFNNKNLDESEIKSITTTLYKNLVKLLHPDSINNSAINIFFNSKSNIKNKNIDNNIFKIYNNVNNNLLSSENLFILLDYFYKSNDIYGITALDTITSIILNQKYQRDNNFIKKTVFLLNFFHNENNNFIKKEPYCFYNEFNNPKWIENKRSTLDHKLKLKEQSLTIQKELLNRIDSIIK